MSKSTQTHGLKWMESRVTVLGSPWRLSHPRRANKNVCDWVHLHNKHLQSNRFTKKYYKIQLRKRVVFRDPTSFEMVDMCFSIQDHSSLHI